MVGDRNEPETPSVQFFYQFQSCGIDEAAFRSSTAQFTVGIYSPRWGIVTLELAGTLRTGIRPTSFASLIAPALL